MGEPAQQDIVQQLIDNAAEIISASTCDGPERLADLAQRQKQLKRALVDGRPYSGAGASRASIETLRDLVAKAVDAVRAEMDQNRGSMKVTGVRKKVLRAYGTVTVSNAPTR